MHTFSHDSSPVSLTFDPPQVTAVLVSTLMAVSVSHVASSTTRTSSGRRNVRDALRKAPLWVKVQPKCRTAMVSSVASGISMLLRALCVTGFAEKSVGFAKMKIYFPDVA